MDPGETPPDGAAITLSRLEQSFRNANFHFQEDLFSQKLLEFLEADASEKWAYELYVALKAFFVKQLPINEYLDALPERDA